MEQEQIHGRGPYKSCIYLRPRGNKADLIQRHALLSSVFLRQGNKALIPRHKTDAQKIGINFTFRKSEQN